MIELAGPQRPIGSTIETARRVQAPSLQFRWRLPGKKPLNRGKSKQAHGLSDVEWVAGRSIACSSPMSDAG